jgi:hypothetical protein
MMASNLGSNGMIRSLGWGAAGFLSAAIALFSYRYLVGMGPLAPGIVANPYARPFLYLHVAGAATALLVMPLQILPRLRSRRPGLHRWIGRLYVAGCTAGGVGGFVVAFGSTAGWPVTMGFGLLAPIWVGSTIMGWRSARARRFAEHRAWMIRSAALTFAAVTLRLYLPMLQLTGVNFLLAYRLTAFISWIPNLIVAELYLRGYVPIRRRLPAAVVA